MNAQRELFFPPISADSIIAEKLAALTVEFNSAEGDPDTRCAVFAEIKRLRALLGKERDR